MGIRYMEKEKLFIAVRRAVRIRLAMECRNPLPIRTNQKTTPLVLSVLPSLITQVKAEKPERRAVETLHMLTARRNTYSERSQAQSIPRKQSQKRSERNSSEKAGGNKFILLNGVEIGLLQFFKGGIL